MAKKQDSHPFSEIEKTRFHNLLKLASESTFDGERAAALSAAKRLARRHGMSLDEAAQGVAEPPVIIEQKGKGPDVNKRRAQDLSQHVHMMDNWVSNDKLRRDAALAEAYERGLDNYGRKRGNVQAPRRKGTQRNPQSHAKVLLEETNMPITEIAELTGLDVYEVVGIKLKLRAKKNNDN